MNKVLKGIILLIAVSATACYFKSAWPMMLMPPYFGHFIISQIRYDSNFCEQRMTD